MRKSILAIALCSSTIVLVAARCGGDDESASASTPAATESPEAASTAAPEAAPLPEDAAAAAAAGDAGGAKEPDDMFRDPLESPEGAPGGVEEMGELPPAGDDTFLDDPSFEPEAPTEGTN